MVPVVPALPVVPAAPAALASPASLAAGMARRTRDASSSSMIVSGLTVLMTSRTSSALTSLTWAVPMM